MESMKESGCVEYGRCAMCCGVSFFFQAEDGIRDYKVTGVQTCALPICFRGKERHMPAKPTIEQLRETARTYDLHLSDADLESFTGLMGAVLESYRRMDQLTQPALPVSYQRSGGYRPSAEENPLNAWYQKCSIKGAASGFLAGKRIAIKDNVCVAGVPMMNGSSVLESYVPEFDATIVTRILDAGGEIVGKAVCEHLCFSGGSHTSDTGPVLNPHDHTRSAGGSSSGRTAPVVAGECEMAIGGDQGGSIRIPSAWCGAYGLKPTHWVVPNNSGL